MFEATINEENISRKLKKAMKTVEGIFQWIKTKDDYFIEEISNHAIRIIHTADKSIYLKINYKCEFEEKELREQRSLEKSKGKIKKEKRESKSKGKIRTPSKKSISRSKSISGNEESPRNKTSAQLPIVPVEK